MKLRLACLSLALASVVSAQSSLPIASAGLQYIWVPPPQNVTFFFDMTVNTTVTFQGVGFTTLAPVGSATTLQMWVTNTGITTYVGNEANPAAWTLGASGPTTIPPVGAGTPGACFTSGLTLQPGNYGIAITAIGSNVIFANNNNLPQTFSNTELTVNLGSTSYNGFTGGALANYVFVGTLYYGVGTVAHGCATQKAEGRGCNVLPGSFYQTWTTSAAAAAALNGRSLTLLNVGATYVVVQGGATWIPPTAAAAALPTNSNGESPVTLPTPFSYPGGSTTTLDVATDGHVSVGSNLSLPGTQSYSPYVPAFLNAANPMWAVAWHNFNTTETGSGLIKYEQVGNLMVITWDGVENWPNMIGTTQIVNPSRFQAQFDLSNGNVHYVYQQMDAQGGSQYYDYTLVGWSPGGPSPDPGPTNLTTFTSLALSPVEVFPLTLTATAAPVLGTSIDLVTSNEPPASIGINFLGLTPLPPPGVPLDVLGAPGCSALLDVTTAIGNLISNLGSPFPGLSVTLPVPSSLALLGLPLASQSVVLDPAANAFGGTFSNGIHMTVGSFTL